MHTQNIVSVSFSWCFACFTPRHACAAMGQVIALGLEYIYIDSAKNTLSKVHFSTGSLLFKFNGLQYHFAAGQVFVAFTNPASVPFCKGSSTPETQTMPAPNHTPYGIRYTVEHAYSTGTVCSIASSSRALADILEVHNLGGGSAWCLSGPLMKLAYSAAASVFISREAWETQNHQTFSSISTLGPGDGRLCMMYETCACVIHTNLQLHYYSTSQYPGENLLQEAS